ncbi:hypothetical protein CC79DRAFT_1164709 [Sarocladium strictum]
MMCTFWSSIRILSKLVYVYLSFDINTGTLLLALSEYWAFIITLPRRQSTPIHGAVDELAGFMSFVIVNIQSQEVLKTPTFTGTVLVYNSDLAAAALLSIKIARSGRSWFPICCIAFHSPKLLGSGTSFPGAPI